MLEDLGVPYMVIGGVATLAWGKPRTTRDVDVTVWVPEEREKEVGRALLGRFGPLEESADQALARLPRRRLLRVKTSTGLPADLVFGTIPYEHDAIQRAQLVAYGSRTVRVCAPEDLVLHKLIADRPQDREDVEGVIVQQGKNLNRRYLDPQVKQLAESMARPEILSFYKACLNLAKEAHG